MDSVILLDKEEGITSFRSLGEVKRRIDRKTGHAGTLDSFASGLMIAMTGSCTKLNPYFMGLDKTYVAVFRLGAETDTLDPEGGIIFPENGEVPEKTGIKEEDIRKVIDEKLKGKILQAPPRFSAVHVDGKRAHALARSGEDFEIPEREVTVYSFDILSWEDPLLTISVKVSKGTYVRSLARDLGHLLGTGAYVTNLRRMKIGPFSVTEAQSVDEFLSKGKEEAIVSTFNLVDRLASYKGISRPKPLLGTDGKIASFTIENDAGKTLSFGGGK